MKRNGIIYWYSFLPVIVVLIGLSFIANFEDGKLTFWNYVPLINPLMKPVYLALLRYY